MSTTPSSRKPLHRTLAEVRDQILADENLPARRRQDISSALRTVAKVLERRLEEIPGHPLYLRERFTQVMPALAGLSETRWRNAVSLTRAALKLTGLAFVPGRYSEPLAPVWADLFCLLNGRRERFGLSRFARYCGIHGIAPNEVDDRVLGQFLQDLEGGGIINKPRAIHRTTCHLWNQVAASIPSWPQQRVAVPSYRNTYALPWNSFPASLKADVDDYLEHLAGKDPLADFTPLKPASIESRATLLHEFASAVVHQGCDPASLRTMRDLVAIDVVKDGLRFFIARGLKRHQHDIACVLRAAARHWVKVDDPHLDEIKKLCRRLSPGKPGMTDKNRARLRPFDDPANVAALLTLPARIIRGLPSQNLTYRQAIEVQTALAIELLLMVPMRIRNLVAIHIDRQIHRSRTGMVHLAIGGEEIKNGVNIEAELPAETVRLLDFYIDQCRPLLLAEPSNWLFPGRANKAKSDQAVRGQIMTCIKVRCGLIMNPHLFRHFAAKICLAANPGGYGLVRLLHGHKSVDTTTQFYCGLEAPAAVRHYDEHVVKIRAGARLALAKAASPAR
jgi:integrase